MAMAMAMMMITGVLVCGKFSATLSCSCYLFVGDWGFEPGGGPRSPRMDDRREEEDESELVQDLEDCKLPDLEECKPPDFEGGEAPGSVIVKPECFIKQNNRNTSSLSAWVLKLLIVDSKLVIISRNYILTHCIVMTCSSNVTISGGAFEVEPFCRTTLFRGIFRFMFIFSSSRSSILSTSFLPARS